MQDYIRIYPRTEVGWYYLRTQVSEYYLQTQVSGYLQIPIGG